jgi:hypothetical protein
MNLNENILFNGAQSRKGAKNWMSAFRMKIYYLMARKAAKAQRIH